MDHAVIDVETIPAQFLPSDCMPEPDMSAVKYGATKDPFKRREIEEQYVADFNTALSKKMSVDPDLCQVCAIVLRVSGNVEWHDVVAAFAVDEHEEHEIIRATWEIFGNLQRNDIPLVSFNGLSFDIPVLLRRAMLLDITVPPGVVANLLRRQENNHHHYDLMQLLGRRNPFSGKMEFHSLDYYLRRFGLGAKMTDWDGSKVYPAWQEGHFQEIIDYCRDDVAKTGELFERVAPWIIPPKYDYAKTKSTTTDQYKGD
jgi:predicted PolB exonuclease-like 3'-5' exonuclease